VLYLINHVESELGDRLHHGNLDPALSPKGIGQVGPLSKIFKGKKLDLIVTPSVSRNSETAVLLASLTGAHIFIDEGLRTWRQGAFSGQPRERVEALVKTYLRHPSIKVPQGESADSFLKRAKQTLLKYLGMSQMSKMDIALVLNSLSIQAAAGRFKTVDLRYKTEDGDVFELGPGLTLKKLS